MGLPSINSISGKLKLVQRPGESLGGVGRICRSCSFTDISISMWADRLAGQAFMSWSQFRSHVFDSDAVVKPLCPLADCSRGCFFWAPAPLVCVLFGLWFVFRVLWRNASLAGGFAGRRVLVVLFLLPLWFDLRLTWTNCVLYTNSFHCLCSCEDQVSVRHRPNSRKKKTCTATPFGKLQCFSERQH